MCAVLQEEVAAAHAAAAIAANAEHLLSQPPNLGPGGHWDGRRKDLFHGRDANKRRGDEGDLVVLGHAVHPEDVHIALQQREQAAPPVGWFIVDKREERVNKRLGWSVHAHCWLEL